MCHMSVSIENAPSHRVFARLFLALVVLLSGVTNAYAQSDPAAMHQLQSNGRGSTFADSTLGWDFQVTQELVVTDLGFFDMLETTSGSIGDGLFEAHAVGIWDESGTLLVSGVVAGGTAAPEESGFRYVAVPETELQPGVTYIIGAHFTSGCDFTNGGSGDCVVSYVQGGILVPPKFAWDARVNPIGRRWGGVGFAAPLDTGTNPAFGPSFKFVPGDDPPPPPPAPPGETVIDDPLGDFSLLAGPLPPGAPNPPDLLEVRAGFDSTHLHVHVEFAPGSMQAGATGLFYVLGLDLDLNMLTGGSFVPGADATLLFASDLLSATICDGSLTFESCNVPVPVTLDADALHLSIPLDAAGIDDDGAAHFGFVAGLFVDGAPAAEDAAFGGTSGSLERQFAAVSGNLLAAPVPGLAPWALGGLVVALGAAARRRVRGVSRHPIGSVASGSPASRGDGSRPPGPTSRRP